MHGTANRVSKQRVTWARLGSSQAQSSLVRRLATAVDDPGKRRIREWLAALDDEQLLGFGLTDADIAVLRET